MPPDTSNSASCSPTPTSPFRRRPGSSSTAPWLNSANCPRPPDRVPWRACSRAAPAGLGRWEEALSPLTRAAEAAPDQLEAWLGLGWCLKRLDRLDEAIEKLRSGLEAAPGQPLLLYNLACYHSLTGDVNAAVDHLTKAISIDDRFRDLTGEERDFDPIRSDPRFVAVTHAVV